MQTRIQKQGKCLLWVFINETLVVIIVLPEGQYSMGRSTIPPICQPDEVTCGPSALQVALKILGKRCSFSNLKERCQTSIHGTSTTRMIRAINSLGLSALVVEKSTLKHLQSALRYSPLQKKAVIVSYMYDDDDNGKPDIDSEHWAVVASYSASKNRIILLDSYSGQKKSYAWGDFRQRWKGFSIKHRTTNKKRKQYEVIKKKELQLMLVVSKEPEVLPKFTIRTARTFAPSVSVS